MQHTTNFNLNLPEGYDQFDIAHFNQNTQKIDTELKNVKNVTDRMKNNQKKLLGTLNANETEVVFTDSAITSSSLIDVYTDKFGVNPSDCVQAGNTVTLTFTAQTVDVDVAIVVNNWEA